MITLELLTLHQLGGPTLPLRRDEAQPQPQTWRAGVSQWPSDAPMALVLDELDAPVKLTATLLRSPGDPQTLGLRALAAPGSTGPIFAVEPAVLDFGDALQAQVELSCVLGGSASVGLGDLWLRWQLQVEGLPLWIDLEWTGHRIYRVLRRPTEPWSEAPDDPLHWPWTRALEYACRWAGESSDLAAAATAITRAVYDLGFTGVFAYDCPLGASRYAFPFFDLQAVIERLGGGFGNGAPVNCSDCATIVSTFANLLGCDLWQSQMFTLGQGFGVNAMIPIGTSGWQVPCGWPGFSFHEVAWTGDCGEDDDVYDASLAVDGSGSPSLPPRFPVLATGLRFGEPLAQDYRFRLAAPGSQQACAPQPPTRQRRRFAFEPPSVSQRAAAIEAEVGWQQWAGRNALDEELLIRSLDLSTLSLPGWSLRQLRQQVSGELWLLRSLWSAELGSALLRVDLYLCRSREAAQGLLVRSLAEFEGEEPHELERGGQEALGDVAFALRSGDAVAFARANVFALVLPASRGPSAALELARRLDARLWRRPSQRELGTSVPPERGRCGQPLALCPPSATPEATTVERVFADRGRLALVEGRVELTQLDPGTVELEFMAEDHRGQGFVEHRRVELDEADPSD